MAYYRVMSAYIPPFTGEGSNLDYEVNSAQVTFNAANSSVNVALNQDNVALEPNETFTLELDPTGTLSVLFFIMNTINITIVDSDGEIQCCFDYTYQLSLRLQIIIPTEM